MECNICVNRFKDSPKSPYRCIKCPYCEESACYRCWKMHMSYLGDRLLPLVCMFDNCKKGWDRYLLYNRLGPSWVMGYYTKYKKEILYQQQKAMFPETLVFMHITQLMCRAKKKTITKDEFQTVKNELCTYRKELDMLMDRDSDFYSYSISFYIRYLRILDDTKTTTEKKKLYFGRCSVESCDSFIKKNGKCDTCDVITCLRCRERFETDHKCDPNTVKNIEALKKQSKPCPGCGSSISRVEGCYQMWCVFCRVLFDWGTMEILNERPHNPHYIQWANENNVVLHDGGCGIIDISCNTYPGPHSKVFVTILNAASNINPFYQGAAHIFRYGMNHMVAVSNKIMYKKRKHYLRKGYDKSKFMTNIMKVDKEKERYCDFIDTTDLLLSGISALSQLAGEQLNKFRNTRIFGVNIDAIGPVVSYLEKVAELINMCNGLYHDRGRIYNTKFPQVRKINTSYYITYFDDEKVIVDSLVPESVRVAINRINTVPSVC